MKMVGLRHWASTGSALASFLFIWAMVRNYIPRELEVLFSTTFRRLFAFLNPYNEIKLHEYSSDRMRKDELYSAAEAYLGAECLRCARRLKAELRRKNDRPLLTIDDYEEVVDTFNGVKVRWRASKTLTKSSIVLATNVNTPNPEERRYYRLSFPKRHRELIENDYLQHVLTEGRALIKRNRKRKLFTNNLMGSRIWSCVDFEHPATFDTLAMDPKRKQEIINDLVAFREGKEYYKKVGKVWKRGYLLYGPPGTGKSTMIAAIANFLEYDVYDLELTAVRSNMDLRKIFLETTGKSIIVIEDIDCSVDLTGKRKDRNQEHSDKTKALPSKAIEESDKASQVTLSGLLNFIDGLWSACGGERIVIFTTNYIEKLDPALIRRGRMDMHIEMSYCTFEAFKVLAKNYLDVENHRLFDSIRELLSEVKMSPADAAEGLMVKGSTNKEVDVEFYLQNMIEQLIKSKEEEAKKNAQDHIKNESKEEPLDLQEQGKEDEDKNF